MLLLILLGLGEQLEHLSRFKHLKGTFCRFVQNHFMPLNVGSLWWHPPLMTQLCFWTLFVELMYVWG